MGKKIWEKTRRLSGLSRRSSTRDSALHNPRAAAHRPNESAPGVVIELEDALQHEEKDDTKAGASVSVRGFEVVGTVGGTPTKEEKGMEKRAGRGRVVSSPLIERAGNAVDLGEGESSDEEVERRPLVRL